MLSVGYVGSNSVHLYQSFQINAPPPGPGDLNSRRPIPLVDTPPFGIIPVGNIVLVEPRGLANYHSLQLKAEKRFGNGLFFLTSWIWSKSIDYAGIAFGDGTSGAINNNSNLSAERGESARKSGVGRRMPFEINVDSRPPNSHLRLNPNVSVRQKPSSTEVGLLESYTSGIDPRLPGALQ